MKAGEGKYEGKFGTAAAVILTAGAAVAALFAMGAKYPGQALAPLAKALLLATMVFVYGFFIMRLAVPMFKRKGTSGAKSTVIRFSTALGTGLIFTSFFFFAVCFMRVLTPAVIIVFYAVPAVLLGVILYNKEQRPILVETVKTFFKRPALQYPVFFLPFIYAMLPPSFYDSLVYHLGIPNLFLAHGGFVETPQFFFANTSVYYEVSLIPAVFAGDLVPRLFHFILGSFFILAIADFARDRFNLDGKTKTILVILMVSMPVSLFLLSTVKSDLPGAFFVFLGIRCMLEKRFAVSGVFWGFAVGVKYFNGLAMAVFIIIYIVYSIYKKMGKMEKTGKQELQVPGLKKLAALTVVIAAMMAPLLIKNQTFAGNPVFPFLSQLEPFKNEYWDESRFALMQSDVGKMFHTPMDVLKFPYTLSFHTLGFGGVVGAQFLIFLPLLLLIRAQLRKKWLLLLFAVLTLYAGGFFTVSVRFVYIAVLFLAIYAAAVYRHLPGKIRWLRYLFWFVIVVNLVTGLGFQEQLYRSHRLLAGNGGAETYKASMFPTYKAMDFVNKNAAPDSNVLLAGEARNYYLKVPYTAATGIDYSTFKKFLRASIDAESFFKAIKSDGYTHIIFNLGEATRLQQAYNRLTINQWLQMKTYLQSITDKAIFKENGVFVFKLD